jgi:transitional endoplasmic reticulum ATPase
MCDKLFAMEVANKDKVFEKKSADSESSDFDMLLDKFIKEQLEDNPVTETTDGSIYYSGDDYTTDNSDDATDSNDDDPFDFNKRDDGALSAKVKINKRKGKGFSDVAGMDNLKGLLKRNFIDIVRNSEMAKMYNIKPSNGILLYGPPGCGKTFIAEKIAEEASLNFVMVKPSDLGSTYIHGTQTKIADLFKKAEKEAPALLCFDEFDTLVPSRDVDTSHSSLTEVNEFLVQLNNCASRGVYVLAMTNNINMIDGAVLRKGRIDEVIYVPEPDSVARREMFRLALEKCAMASKCVDCEKLSSLTEGYTSSDIAYIVIEASREAFHRAVEADAMVEVDQEVLEAVIKRTSPSVSPKDLKRYESMRDEFVNKKKQLDIRPRIGFAV